MKLATFNVNGVNGRLPVLLRWLDETAPDIVCLQELKASQDKFPEGPIRDAGYARFGMARKAGTALPSWCAGPLPSKRGAACLAILMIPTAVTSRRPSMVCWSGCLYLPNGNPAPGPKFDFKLRWFDRLATRAESDHPVSCS